MEHPEVRKKCASLKCQSTFVVERIIESGLEGLRTLIVRGKVSGSFAACSTFDSLGAAVQQAPNGYPSIGWFVDLEADETST